MHHYADIVTEGRVTLEQTESRRKNSKHIISDKGVISSANFVITVIWNSYITYQMSIFVFLCWKKTMSENNR